MNSALENLRKSDPALFKKFIQALQEDLGISGREPLATFQCPACRTRFDISTGMQTTRRKRFRNHNGESLLELLLELARLKKVTTGKIHVEFNKALGDKTKGLRPQQLRELKRDWLKGQIARYRKTAKT